MADKKWTPQQRDAIEARGGTVLVSAAAGSGKTAVLVERVVGRILDEEHPVDADRMLIVTFSNAAALEMKQRITARLSAMIEEHPEDERLQRQQLLLGQAQISTIHAFCLEMIRSNFQQLGISSNIRTGDEKELEILRQDTAREIVEQFHASGNKDFSQLVELLSSGRDDRRVFSTLFHLYDFVRSHPFYNDWLDHKLGFYDSRIPVEQTIWGGCILDYAQEAVSYAIDLNRRALELISEDEAMSKAYSDSFVQDRAQLEALYGQISGGSWNAVCQKLDAFTFEKLRPLRGADLQKAAVQGMRSQIKKLIEELRSRQFCATAEEFSEDIAALRPLVGVLFGLVKAFDRAYTQEKQQRNLMDFSDMEQYAIALLVNPAGAGYSKTSLAQTISTLYDEILVDEFQDTNAAQEMIFRAVSQGENNLFLVGDVKQSIYRFRQAMPELFMKKKKQYAPYNGENFPAKILLGKNFRSVPEVTGSINFFFRMLMSEKLGEIDYNEEEALVAGAKFPIFERSESCILELLDLSEYAGELDKAALEADLVAERVAGLLESGALVTDGEGMRRITPKDICILLRSPSRKAQSYQNALAARGVPVWAEPKNGFLSTREIAPVLSLLRVIQNPLLDIDLAAAMVSALFTFTADELAKIRMGQRGAPLWLAVCKRAEQGDVHCAKLVEILSALRRFAAGATADQIIREIYERFDYPAKVLVMRMGQARYANLLLLVQYACDYHAGGYKGLSGFLGLLDRLLERGGDLSPASSLSEQADVVRIMSIHRSKGLEFPVVFLCDTAKPFNKEDLRQNTLLHSELGFACVRRDFELMKQFTTVPMQALKLEIERSSLSEELRVLYVALTRAKERLFITGVSAKNAREKLAGLIGPLERGRLSPHLVRSASSYLDWILMAALHHPNLSRQLAEWGLEAEQVSDASPVCLRVTKLRDRQIPKEIFGEPALPSPDPSLTASLQKQLDFVYPYEKQTRIPTKMAVSQIAKGELARSYRFSRRPAFLEEDGLTGAQRGNALHKFMQFADYSAAARNPEAEISRMAQQGFLSRKEAEAVDPQKLRAFFASRLAQRIFAAERVYRELRFLAEVGREVLEDSEFFDQEGKTAIQGVADCVFLENGEAVIVDYKSDRVKELQTLADRYRIQLTLYRKVLGESLGTRVKECVIYSFALGDWIVL